MRLVSTVELMAIRERVNNNLSPFDRPVDESTFAIIQQADTEFRNWYKTWDHAFSQKYEDAGIVEYLVNTPRLAPLTLLKHFTGKACRFSICTQSSFTVRLHYVVSTVQKMFRRCQPHKEIWRYAQYVLLARVLILQLIRRRIAKA